MRWTALFYCAAVLIGMLVCSLALCVAVFG